MPLTTPPMSPPEENTVPNPAADAASPRRRPWILLSLLCFLALSLPGLLGGGDLWPPDEPRVAAMGRSMAETPGWSATPMLSGQPFLEQPPLCVWSLAASFRAFGTGPAAARLPIALFGLLLFAVAFLLGERAGGGPAAGFLTVAVLAAMPRFLTKFQAVIPDLPLALFVAGAHLSFLAARDQWRSGRRPAALAAFGLCAGLAFMSKGPIGPILAAGPVLLATAVTDRPLLLRAALGTALAGGAGVALLGVPWVLALARESGWEAVRESLLGNSLGRFAGRTVYGHAAPFWYYLAAFPVAFLPWTLALPAILRGGVLAPDREGGRARFLGLVALSGVLLLSIPSSKRSVYLLPLLPAAAAVPGAWLAGLRGRSPSPLERGTLAALLGVTAAGALLAAAGAAAVASGVSLPAPAAFLGTLPPGAWWTAAAGLGAAGCLLAVRLRLLLLRPSGAAPVAAALSLVALAVAIRWTVEPLADPFLGMREGAIRAASLFPGEGAIPAMAVSETTRSVVPYYAGRNLRVIPTREIPPSFPDLVLVDDRPEWIDGLRKHGVDLEIRARIPLNREHAVLVVHPTAP